MPEDPYVAFWADQFGALVRDKCRQMQSAIVATGWSSCAHVFEDPSDGDRWRLTYEQGIFYLTNLSDDENHHVVLDIEALGVNRYS